MKQNKVRRAVNAILEGKDIRKTISESVSTAMGNVPTDGDFKDYSDKFSADLLDSVKTIFTKLKQAVNKIYAENKSFSDEDLTLSSKAFNFEVDEFPFDDLKEGKPEVKLYITPPLDEIEDFSYDLYADLIHDEPLNILYDFEKYFLGVFETFGLKKVDGDQADGVSIYTLTLK